MSKGLWELSCGRSSSDLEDAPRAPFKQSHSVLGRENPTKEPGPLEGMGWVGLRMGVSHEEKKPTDLRIFSRSMPETPFHIYLLKIASFLH